MDLKKVCTNLMQIILVEGDDCCIESVIVVAYEKRKVKTGLWNTTLDPDEAYPKSAWVLGRSSLRSFALYIWRPVTKSGTELHLLMPDAWTFFLQL